MNIKWVGSPNYDTNRKPVRRIICHWIVGTLASTDAVFQDPVRQTSAHYGIEDGNIHQYVKEEHVGYHAGNYAINQESIGIEHSATPDRPASDATYNTSGQLIAEICKRYNIPLTREFIEPHNKYRATQCPGTMDLDRLIAIAKNNTVPMVTLPQAEADQLRADRDKNWNEREEYRQKYEKCEIDLNKCQNKPPQIVTETKEVIVEKIVEKLVPAVDLKKLSFRKRIKLLFS